MYVQTSDFKGSYAVRESYDIAHISFLFSSFVYLSFQHKLAPLKTLRKFQKSVNQTQNDKLIILGAIV